MILSWYFHGARYFDPQLATWHSPDPLSESSTHLSPYAYVANNPVNFVDPNGMYHEGGPSQEEREKINEGPRYGPGYWIYSGYNRTPFENAFSWMQESSGWFYDSNTGAYNNFFTGERMSTNEFSENLYSDILPSMQAVVYTYKPWYQTVGGVGIESTDKEFRGFRLSCIHESNSGGDVNQASNNGDSRALTLSGLTLLTQEGLEVFQGSNQGVRAAAIRNGIPTEAIDDIIRRTGNFQNLSKWAGRGFIAAGVVVNVIDGVQAYNNGDRAGMTMAGMDLIAGLGTAVIGGPAGIILYGGYMLIMHAPVVAEPAFMSDPTSNWNRLPRIDNTYVAPGNQY